MDPKITNQTLPVQFQQNLHPVITSLHDLCQDQTSLDWNVNLLNSGFWIKYFLSNP